MDEKAGIRKVIVCGTRTFYDYGLALKVLTEILKSVPKDRIEIISGGAKGADGIGELFAKRNGIACKRFPADWDRYGKAAGPIRNKEMVGYAGPEGILVAFWDGKSRGTANIIKTAEENGLWARVISINSANYGEDIIKAPF